MILRLRNDGTSTIQYGNLDAERVPTSPHASDEIGSSHAPSAELEIVAKVTDRPETLVRLSLGLWTDVCIQSFCWWVLVQHQGQRGLACNTLQCEQEVKVILDCFQEDSDAVPASSRRCCSKPVSDSSAAWNGLNRAGQTAQPIPVICNSSFEILVAIVA